MVVRHVALVKWKSTATEAQIRVAQDSFPHFVPQIPGVLYSHVAPNIDLHSGSDETWDFGYIADFKDIDGFKTYQAHPLHLQQAQHVVDAAREDSRRIQFECMAPEAGLKGKTTYRRIGLLQWKPTASAAQIAQAAGAIADLFQQTPGIAAFTAGHNLKIDHRPALNWDFAILADFDSLEAFEAYRHSPGHAEARRLHIDPALECRRSALCAWPGGSTPHSSLL